MQMDWLGLLARPWTGLLARFVLVSRQDRTWNIPSGFRVTRPPTPAEKPMGISSPHADIHLACTIPITQLGMSFP